MFKTLKSLRNKCLIFSIFLFLIFFIYSCNPNDPDKDNAKSLKWGVLGKAGFSSEVYANSDIAGLVFDNKGTPYVAYMDADNEEKATVMKYNGSSWVNVGKAGFSVGGAYDISLAINNKNIPYIAYRDMGNGAKATVMKYDGDSWVSVGEAAFSTKKASYTSLAIDNNDIAYIAYLGNNDTPEEGTVTVMKYDDTTWEVVGDDLPAEKSCFIRLAIDNKGTPYIVYLDKVAGEKKYKATVMKYDGTWNLVGTADFATVLVDILSIGISLAFDNNNIPYVAYEDAENKIDILEIGNATVMKFDGGYWEVVGKAGFSTRGASSISLAFDDRNAPYVAYEDASNRSRATVMRYNGLYWGLVGEAGFSATIAADISLAFYNNVPYVGYNDTSFGMSGKLTVMKYDNRY